MKLCSSDNHYTMAPHNHYTMAPQIVVDAEVNEKEKGVNKNIVRGIRHKKFVEVLFGKKLMRHRMKTIQSKLHKIGTFVWNF